MATIIATKNIIHVPLIKLDERKVTTESDFQWRHIIATESVTFSDKIMSPLKGTLFSVDTFSGDS